MRLTTSFNPQIPNSFSPDGRSLVLMEVVPKNGYDLNLLHVEGLRAGQPLTQPLVSTTFNEQGGEVSPDGHWLAYFSNESGQDEVYVRPFPKVDGGRWQISTGGGTRPAWARSGRELLYLTPTALMSVSVQTTPTFSAGNPQKVFDGVFYAAVATRTYDVSADGQRFLMIKNTASTGETAPPASMVVVEHWTEELKRLLPVK